MKIERGDILMVNLGQVPGTSLQSGIRPVVVVSNNKANTYSPVVTVVPFTSRVYLVRIGNMKVKVRFANNGISLEQAFENMLLSV